jgi:annexin D
MEETYEEGKYDADRMKDDIKKLQDMGLGKMGCDENKVFRFLCESPPEYLKKINIGYAEESGVTLAKALESELRGDAEAAATFLIGMKTNPYESIAKVLHRATKGFGTNEALLQVTLIRYQGVLNDVKLAFVDEYGKTIQDVIRAECSGDYEDLLLAIVGN